MLGRVPAMVAKAANKGKGPKQIFTGNSAAARPSVKSLSFVNRIAAVREIGLASRPWSALQTARRRRAGSEPPIQDIFLQ